MNPDVVIVGGGAVGAGCALELARRGAQVTLLERGAELAWECSSGNAGLICPSHSLPIANPDALRFGLRSLGKADAPFALRARPALLPWLLRFALAAASPERAARAARFVRELSLESLALHAGLAAEGLDTGFERRGILNVYATANGFAGARREAAAHAAEGLRVEVLERDALLAAEPALREAAAGGLLYPDEAHCDPKRFVLAVGEAARAAGAEIRTRVEVLGLRRTPGGLVVETTRGTLQPDTLVLAAGVWTSRLARQLGLFVPIEGGKGYHVDVEAGAGDPALPVFLQEARVIATPLPGRLRFSGTLELTGVDASVSRTRVDAVERAARSALRTPERPRVDVWRGLRPCTPDGLPVLGRLPEAPDVVLAAGHAMKGISLAPVTGRLVAEIVADGAPARDLSLLAPERFRPLLGI